MSHDKITVTWEVADGYVGGKRPQKTKISHSDILDCESEEDVRACVEESIREDFEQRISADYGDDAYSEALDLWRESQAEKQ